MTAPTYVYTTWFVDELRALLPDGVIPPAAEVEAAYLTWAAGLTPTEAARRMGRSRDEVLALRKSLAVRCGELIGIMSHRLGYCRCHGRSKAVLQ